VTAPREISDGVSPGRDDLRTDAWDVGTEFARLIVADAQARAVRESAGGRPEVDWAAIWRSGDGAPSEEAAIGRIVRAAAETAKKIDLERSKFAPSPTGNGVAAAAVPVATSLTSQPEVAYDPVAPAEPSIVPVGSSVGAPPEHLGPRESELVAPEPVPRMAEPVTMAPAAVGPLTAAPPVTHEMAQSHAVHVDDAPIFIAESLGESDSSDQPGDAMVTTRRETTRPSAWYHVFTWMRNVGVVVLLFVVWQLWGTDIAQHHAQSDLKKQFEAAVQSHHVPAVAGNGEGLIPATTRFAPAADGSVLARLQIPVIGVDQYVVEGTTAGDLSKGPGHYVGTALPGQAGNVAIAGHRTTHGAPFNELGNLMPGDRIILTTTWGENLTYVVSGTRQIITPSDVAVLNYFGDNRITLTTCNPEFSSSQRLVVVGKLRQPPGPHVALPAHLAYHVANANTASWNFSLLPAVGIEICLLLLLALSYRLFDGWFGSRSKWLILVPLWAAGLYLLFGTLTTFLPSSI
jgi:sortase A